MAMPGYNTRSCIGVAVVLNGGSEGVGPRLVECGGERLL